MKNQEFAYNLASFLDPTTVMDSVRRYSEERKAATSDGSLIIASSHLSFGEEGNFAELVHEFLRAFVMPEPFVSLLKELYGTRGYSRTTWRWIEELTFSFDVRSYRHGAAPPGCPRNTILLIHERDAVLDIVRNPILALLDMVGRAAVYWRQAAALGACSYFKADSPDAFSAYTEYRTASSLVDFVPHPDELARYNLKMRYRAITTTGDLLGRDAISVVARETARSAAASTFGPIGEAH